MLQWQGGDAGREHQKRAARAEFAREFAGSPLQVTQRFVLVGTVAAMIGISLALIFAAPAPSQRADGPPATQVVETTP